MAEAQALPFLHRWDASRYQRAYLLAGLSEDAVQLQVVDYLKGQGFDVRVIDAGGKHIRRALKGVLHNALMPFMRDMKARAAKVASILAHLPGAAEEGLPDLQMTLAPSGQAIHLEVKAPGHYDIAGKQVREPGRLKPEQRAALMKLHNRGAIVGAVWSIQDAIEIIGAERIEANRRHVNSLRAEGAAA